jgi:hypothetical protein
MRQRVDGATRDFRPRSRRRDLNRSAMKIATAHKIAYIGADDGPILPQCGNSAPDNIFRKDRPPRLSALSAFRGIVLQKSKFQATNFPRKTKP